MSNFKRAPVTGGRAPRKNPLASLKMAQILDSKPFLPAEIIASIVDYLSVPDLLRFARVSRRMLEMVYDDARWVQRLKRMSCWDEAAATQHAGGGLNGSSFASPSRGLRQHVLTQDIVNGKGRPAASFGNVNGHNLPAVTIGPSAKAKVGAKTQADRYNSLSNGFDGATLASPTQDPLPTRRPQTLTPDQVELSNLQALTILSRVRSIRGQGRQEYGKVYKILGPLYVDITEVQSPMNGLIFKSYKTPEHQAMMLAQVKIFAKSDLAPGASDREQRVAEAMSIFDTAALLEFRNAYEVRNIPQLRKYAQVLRSLNGGRSSIELFRHHNRLLLSKGQLGNPTDCIDYLSGHGQISLERTQLYFDRLSRMYREELAIIVQVFANPMEVSSMLLEKVGLDILSPFLTSLFDEAHTRGVEGYLKTVAGSFAQARQFMRDIAVDTDPDKAQESHATALLTSIFEPHLDLYLAEELGSFKRMANLEVENWSTALSERAASTESFLLSGINRQADKKDFLTSFKKVVMMPVNILPSFPSMSSNKSTAKAPLDGKPQLLTQSQVASRSSSPHPGTPQLDPVRSSTPALSAEAPNTELAAKAAIMNSKLENIRSLFSIEVALNLVHHAKSCLDRAAQFVSLGGSAGEASKQQCAAIFILLLRLLGLQHVKAGFDKAVDHLSSYNPREANVSSAELDTNGWPVDGQSSQVAPLATFLELVNVGDLIQQMLDVFYESELVRLQISNRDDFLDPAVKEKKQFEAMLDERVAAGLGKGIDVLMDEVEYICATTQMPEDFNPTKENFDIGPTLTAKKVIDVVSGHMSMLTGSTDKTLLDVFSGEVGLRLFTTLCKHLKRQRISASGALALLSDLSAYARYITTFKNNDLNSYFIALREVGQIYLIDGNEASEMATIIADGERYRGVITIEEVLEFAERRSDWLAVKPKVERAMYGQGCAIM